MTIDILPQYIDHPQVAEAMAGIIQRKARNLRLSGPESGMCRSPFRLKDTEGRDRLAPCGNCLPCRRRRRETITGSIAATDAIARAEGSGSLFVTFTYDDQHLPANHSDWYLRLEAKSLLKRLQREYDDGISHLLVAEKGENNDRLHWHAILTFHSEADFLRFPRSEDPLNPHLVHDDQLWPNGSIDVREADVRYIRYCAKYCVDFKKKMVYAQKSRQLGLHYFQRWHTEAGKYPVEPPGRYPVPDENGRPIWYPHTRAMRTWLDEEHPPRRARQQRSSETNWLDWLLDGGPAKAEITAYKDYRDRQKEELETQRRRFLAEQKRERPPWMT